MPDGNHLQILTELDGSADRTKPVRLWRTFLSGLLLALGLVVCALIAVLSVGVAIAATVMNGARALWPRQDGSRRKTPDGTAPKA